MAEYRNVAAKPLTLSNGSVLARGETRDLDTLDEHDQHLIDQGDLLEITAKPTRKPRKQED